MIIYGTRQETPAVFYRPVGGKMNYGPEIGQILRNARLDAGYTTRAELVETKALKGKITQEGLRKIELGERVPRFKSIRLLGETLGLSKKKIEEIEKLALQKNVKRMANRSDLTEEVSIVVGNRILRSNIKAASKAEENFVREAIDSLSKLVLKYGVMPEDISHFRRHGRKILIDAMRP